jgi:hypothetical protein
MTDYAKRLAEIERRAVADLTLADACEDRGWLLAQLRAISAAIPMSIVPACDEHSNELSAAERVRILAAEATQEASMAATVATLRDDLRAAPWRR